MTVLLHQPLSREGEAGLRRPQQCREAGPGIHSAFPATREAGLDAGLSVPVSFLGREVTYRMAGLVLEGRKLAQEGQGPELRGSQGSKPYGWEQWELPRCSSFGGDR